MTDLDPLNAGLVKALDLGIAHTQELHRLRVELASPPDGWSTFGTHADTDADLEFWGDDQGTPIWERPVPAASPGLADRTAMSVRVFWETKDWSAARLRAALVDARLGRA